jgi:hypothetical protein
MFCLRLLIIIEVIERSQEHAEANEQPDSYPQSAGTKKGKLLRR